MSKTKNFREDQTNREKILVFIPAYNCEKQLPRVLAQFNGLEQYFDEILVVDNRSTDGTVESGLAAKSKTKVPVTLVRNCENLGLGGSHKVAFKYALEHGFDYCVVLHGDDQGHIRDLIPFLDAGDHRSSDCLLGARFMPGSKLQGYSWFRTFGNKVFNLAFSVVAGRRLYDLGSGLNLYRVNKLKDADFFGFANNLTFNYHMILASVFWQWKIRFFPITWREDDQISNVKLFRQSFQILNILMGYFSRKGAFLSENHSGRDRSVYRYEPVIESSYG